MPMPESERQSLRIEKIENGYLAHHTNDGPKGYQTKTVFHAQKPILTVTATPAAAPAKKGVKK
jgi:hypothetical protein